MTDPNKGRESHDTAEQAASLTCNVVGELAGYTTHTQVSKTLQETETISEPVTCGWLLQMIAYCMNKADQSSISSRTNALRPFMVVFLLKFKFHLNKKIFKRQRPECLKIKKS